MNPGIRTCLALPLVPIAVVLGVGSLAVSTAPTHTHSVRDMVPATHVAAGSVTITEFSDFQCPYCKGAASIVEQVRHTYGERVNIVFKQMPLRMHEYAFKAAQASICAKGQGKFWEYHDRLFSSADLSVDALNRAAAEIGLGQNKFNQCMASDMSRAAVIKDVREAEQLGVFSTPTFFVNSIAVKGATTFVALEREIDLALSREHHLAVNKVVQLKDVRQSLQNNAVLTHILNESRKTIEWAITLSLFLITLGLFGLFSFYALRSKVMTKRIRFSAASLAFLLAAIISVKLIVLVGSAGSKKGSPSLEPSLEITPVSLTKEMVVALPLDPAAIVISEKTYAALLKHRGEALPMPARHSAAVLTANLSDPAALGVIATLQRRPMRIHSDIFIILRDPALSVDGNLEGRDAFVAAVKLDGVVPWFGQSPRVALLSDVRGGAAYRSVPRGCQPIFETRSRSAVPVRFSSYRPELAGLPPTVLMNLESGARPPNASGHRPRLLVFGANPAQPPSAYECYAPVGWEGSSGNPREADRGEGLKPAHTVALPSDAILLDERDFLAAMSHSKPSAAPEHDAIATRRLLVLANSDEALGISARFQKAKTFSGELFAVARDPLLMPDGRVVATEYYLARVKLSGTANWNGKLPEIAFSGTIPEVPVGFCGLVWTPTEVPRCDPAPCGPLTISHDGSIRWPDALSPSVAAGPRGGYPVETGEPRFGADRWPAMSRVTFRMPTFDAGRLGPPDLNAIACSGHRPPRGEGCGSAAVEICNGVDDDCDQDIDEDGVCANRDTLCTP